MATLVKFYVEGDNSILAFFPQINHNKRLYGNEFKRCYAHIGQHSSCDRDYVSGLRLAAYPEYKQLKDELESIGYTLKVLNK